MACNLRAMAQIAPRRLGSEGHHRGLWLHDVAPRVGPEEHQAPSAFGGWYSWSRSLFGGALESRCVRRRRYTPESLLDGPGMSRLADGPGIMCGAQQVLNTGTQVIMSSLVTLPVLTSSYHHGEKIAIFTANGQSLLSSLTGGAGGTGEDSERTRRGCR